MKTTGSWVCLMYHDVTPEPAWKSGGPAFFSVPAADFDRQLSLIQDLGLRGCSIAEGLLQPSGTVAISFDDGDLGQAVRAFPLLAKRGMTATFFVTTSWVGDSKHASWDQLREMRAAGMSIQSHTHTHPFLSQLDARALRDELRRSREALDERLNQHTTMISLPGGDAPRRELRSLLVAEGYGIVATSMWGGNRASDAGIPRYVKRCTVRGQPDDALFRAIVTGDRWLSLKKRTREQVLSFLRASLGPERYARWRGGFLKNTTGTDD